MNVKKLMTGEVKTCAVTGSLRTAAETMWENECGCVPVVDEAGHLVGLLTDRDICMAAHIDERPLAEIAVSDALKSDLFASTVWTCKPDDSLEEAQRIMSYYKVHRVPVVDGEGSVVGILSIDDLAMEADRQRKAAGEINLTDEDVCRTLAAICEPE